MDAKGRAEAHLQRSGLAHTIVRPVLFMEDWIAYLMGAQLAHSGEIRLVQGGSKPLSFVSCSDIAELLVTLAGLPEAQNQVVTASAGWTTHREIVGMIEGIQGRSIPITDISPGEEIPGLPPMFAHLWAGLVMGPDQQVDALEVVRLTGESPRSVESFVRQVFALP